MIRDRASRRPWRATGARLAVLATLAWFANGAHAQDGTREPAEATARDATCADMRAVASERLRVTVDCGERHGIERGDRIAFFRAVETALGDGEVAVERREEIVGVVVAVSPRRARVQVGTNERVAAGTDAATTEAPLTASAIAPPRSPARSSLELGTRLVVTATATGAGGVVDGRFMHRFRRRGFVGLRLDPTGGAAYRRPDPDGDGPRPRPPGSSTVVASAFVLAGYDLGPVAIGVGVGTAMTTRLRERRLPCDTCAEETIEHGYENGLAFAATARFGVPDGLSLEVDTAFVTALNGFEVSRFGARLRVPVHPRASLVAQGMTGFGAAGARVLELGTRVLVRGDGGPRSFYIVPTAGFVGLVERATIEVRGETQSAPDGVRQIVGLSAGLSIENRF